MVLYTCNIINNAYIIIINFNFLVLGDISPKPIVDIDIIEK